MTALICPTVTASTPHEYRAQLENILPFAGRIHLDLMDGALAPTISVRPEQLWFPETVVTDIHVMFQRPIEFLETLISLKPHMIIFHDEADGELTAACEHVQKLGIKAGIALLPQTTVQNAAELIEVCDHVLLFGGTLGSFGGHADLSVLEKIPKILELNPKIEIGWDGGASVENAKILADAGVQVINVGGGIQHADNAAIAFEKFNQALL